MMPSFSVMAFMMASELQSMHGVVVHTCKWYLPTGSRLYIV